MLCTQDSNSTAEFIERFCGSSSQRGSPQFSDDLSSLLRAMLVVDPSKRIPTPSILAHPWLQESAPPVKGRARARSDKKLSRPLGSVTPLLFVLCCLSLGRFESVYLVEHVLAGCACSLLVEFRGCAL